MAYAWVAPAVVRHAPTGREGVVLRLFSSGSGPDQEMLVRPKGAPDAEYWPMGDCEPTWQGIEADPFQQGYELGGEG